MKFGVPRTIRLEDYTPSSFLIDQVTLDVCLDIKKTSITSRLHIRKNPLSKKAPTPLVLNAHTLELNTITLDGRELLPSEYVLSDTRLQIPKVPNQPFVLETRVTINPEKNLALQGLYLSRGVFCTQCEAEGFRRITYFIDRPDILSVFTCRIEANKKIAPILLSNGNLVQKGNLNDGKRHYAIWHDPFPKPCYLFALVAGDLASKHSSFKTKSGKSVKLGMYVEHGKEGLTSWAMDSLKRSMKWDEDVFNREYDLDLFNIVAVSDFNMGAMENKGLNIFNDRLILASEETATDASFEAIESVVAHEYFHNWTGNRITCRDWFQLCLKEGLTVYRDQEFSADERDRTVQRIADVRQLRSMQFPEDAGPLAHPVRPETYIEINNFYTPTVYEKGAEVIRMLEILLGQRKFQKGMTYYFSKHDGEAVTIEDFLNCFEKASLRDLSQFKLWYTQAGTPEIVVTAKWYRSTKTYELKFNQFQRPSLHQAKKKSLHIPIRLALLGADGKTLPLKLEDGTKVNNGVLELTKRSESFRFVNIHTHPIPSLFRGFSAPVRLTFEQSIKDLEFLMLHDDDLYNRWQATYTFALRLLRKNSSLTKEKNNPSDFLSFAQALRRLIIESKLNPAYRAECVKLPTQSDLAREIGRNVNHDHIYRAHKKLSQDLATFLGDDLETIYSKLRPKGKFSPDAKSAGLRALRNAALTLLSSRELPSDHKRLLEHFKKNSSMTDKAHALNLIASYDISERMECLSAFYDRWQKDHLVIDLWFSAQAQSPLADTLDRVRSLTKHPLFNFAIPNKVRALIGTFAMQNPLQFNRPDGEGYHFVAEQVLKVDPINPQIAARLLGAFKSWGALEKGRKAKAREALSHVAKQKGLSRDLYEIVSKTLEN
ncbi:MAG: aminopeptidase N [Hyphomicrobium sp.]